MHRLVVEHGPPVEAGVVGLPDPPGRRAGEVRVAVSGDAGHGGDAVAHGPDVAGAQPLVLLGRELLGRQRRGGRRGQSETSGETMNIEHDLCLVKRIVACRASRSGNVRAKEGDGPEPGAWQA